MVVRVDEKSLRAAIDFIQAGTIGSSAGSNWIELQANKESGSVFLAIAGDCEYMTMLDCKVLQSGRTAVNSRIFCELVSKIKNPKSDSKLTLGVFADDQSNMKLIGNGIEYKFPVGLDIVASFIPVTMPEFEFCCPVSALIDASACMKAIKDAESDADIPCCEILLDGLDLQFVANTRYRSVSCWIAGSWPADSEVDRSKKSQSFFVAIDHLVKMDKALKALIKLDKQATVLISASMNSVTFSFGDSVGKIKLRCMEKRASKIHELLAWSERLENIQTSIHVDGGEIKQAYDRLDAFGKRNSSSVHRIDFKLVGYKLEMRASAGGIGGGVEVVSVESLMERDFMQRDLLQEFKFAASGAKLADLLRISSYMRVDMIIGRKAIVIKWIAQERMRATAILAGLSI